MNTFTKGILPVLILTLLFFSCKKNEGGEEPVPPNSSEAWLLAPSTGWKHVTTIDNTQTIAVYDMTSFGQEIGVLYSGLSYSNGPTISFYKVKFKENDVKAPEGTKLGFSTSGKTIYHGQFIPESYTPVFTNLEYVGNTLGLIDESNTRTVRFVTDRTQPADEIINYYYTKTGDYLAGVVLGSHIPFATQYGTSRFPPAPITDGFMPTISTDKDRGNFISKIVIPLKLSDDKPYTFTIGTESSQLKYQVLKLFPEKQRIDPNYEIVDQAAFTGLEASGLDPLSPYRSLVSYSYDNDVLTFVLADYKIVSNVYQMNKLHCYRWKKGASGLTTLWESPAVDITLANAIEKDEKTNGVSAWPYLENRLTPDGTFYTIFTKALYTEPQPESEYTVLYTVNSTGIKELNRTDYIYKNYKKQCA